MRGRWHSGATWIATAGLLLSIGAAQVHAVAAAINCADRDTTRLLDAGFEEETWPDGWSLVTAPGSPGWQIGDSAAAASPFFPVPAHGRFAWCSSDGAGPGVYLDDRLLSPTVQLPTGSALRLAGSAFFLSWGNQALVEVRVTGSDWTPILDLPHALGWSFWIVDLTAWCGSEVQFALHYRNTEAWAHGVAVDDLMLLAIGDDIQPPYLAGVPVQHHLTDWLPLHLEATAVDSSGVHVVARVWPPSAGPQELALAPQGDDRFSGELVTTSDPGIWSIRFEAVDQSPQANQTTGGTFSFPVGLPAWLRLDDGGAEASIGHSTSGWQMGAVYHPGRFPLRVDSVQVMMAQSRDVTIHLTGLDADGRPDLSHILASCAARTTPWTPFSIALPSPLVVQEDFACVLAATSGHVALDTAAVPWRQDAFLRMADEDWTAAPEWVTPGQPWIRVHVDQDSARHFQAVAPTSQSATVVLSALTLNGHPMEVDDEVGVYDGELCVGAARLLTIEGPLVVTTFAAETGVDGFTEGDSIEARIWARRFGLEANAHLEILQGPADFHTGDTTYVAASVSTTTPPAAFSLLAPVDCLPDTSSRIDFQWQRAWDPDPWDLVRYRLVIRRAGDSLVVLTDSLALGLDAPAWVLSEGSEPAIWTVTALSQYPPAETECFAPGELATCLDVVPGTIDLVEPPDSLFVSEWETMSFCWTAVALSGVQYRLHLNWVGGERNLETADTMLIVSLQDLDLPECPTALSWRVGVQSVEGLDSLESESRALLCSATAVEPVPMADLEFTSFPNPFNSRTLLRVNTRRLGKLQVRIHNTRGQLVSDWVVPVAAAGRHEFVWEEPVASGLYFATVWLDDQTGTTLRLGLVR
jgi:hypothetical protein